MFLAKELLETMRCILNDKKIQSIKPTHRRQEFWVLQSITQNFLEMVAQPKVQELFLPTKQLL
jgi:hypothetical protein